MNTTLFPLATADWGTPVRNTLFAIAAVLAVPIAIALTVADAITGTWKALVRIWGPAQQALPPAQPEAPAPVPAPPAVQPLYTELAHLPVSHLRTLAGTRSKRFRRAELLAMVAA
jgi:hypothetical protein